MSDTSSFSEAPETLDAPEAVEAVEAHDTAAPVKPRSIFVGRRKAAVARARMTRGTGVVTVNGRAVDEYFTTDKLRGHALAPLVLMEVADKFDIDARISGGGSTGQSGALRLAIARALIAHDEAWRAPLKAAGMLTRDARKVERKKFGLKKARRAPQYSKR
jgi:small subunit ribosomal protein S9